MNAQDYMRYAQYAPMIYGGITNPMSMLPSSPVGATAAPTFGSMGGYASAAQGLLNAYHAGDVGGDVEEQFAHDTGMSTSDLPDAPGFLSKGSKRKREVAIAAANFIPFVGPLVSGVLRGFDTAKESRVAARYLGSLIGDIPGMDQGVADEMTHAVRPSGMESLDTGLAAMRGSLAGPLAKISDPILSKIDPIHILAGRKQKEREQEMEQAKLDLKRKAQDAQIGGAQRATGNAGLGAAYQAGAYGNDPQMAYILSILQHGRR